MLRILTLLWGKFFLWITQPVVAISVVVSLLIFATSFYYFDVPAIGVAVKKFALNTLPKWLVFFKKFVVKFTAKHSGKKLLRGLISLFAFKSVTHYLELRVLYIRRQADKALDKWRALSTKAKIGWGTTFFCLLWIPFGGWVLLFVPIVVVKDILLRIFKFILGKLGLSFAFGKLVNFCYSRIVPRPLRAKWHWKVSRPLSAKQRRTRKKLENTDLGKSIVEYTKEGGHSLKKKLDPRDKSKEEST